MPEVRPIDANALLKDLNEAKIPYNADVNSFIISAPTLDYEPVVHAHWDFDDSFKSANKRADICSNCKWAVMDDIDSDLYEYCPYCGAKMDEEVKG